MLALYAAAGEYVRGARVDPRLYWLLGGAVLLAGVATLVGWLRGWQERRALLLAWPVASLVVEFPVPRSPQPNVFVAGREPNRLFTFLSHAVDTARLSA